MTESGTGAIRTIAEPFPATPALHGLLASAYEVTDAIVSGVGPFVDFDSSATLDDLKRSRPDEYDRIMQRWEIGGYSITPENCVMPDTFDPDCANWPGGVQPPLPDAPVNEATYHVAPVGMDTSFRCDAAGFQVVDYQGRAERQLASATSKAMEFELWTGSLNPNNPNLASGPTVLGGGLAFPSAQAFAILGQYLSNVANGGQGMIHAPTLVVDEWLWFSSSAIKEQGNRLRSVNRGDIIVSGTGYPGTGPGGLPVEPGQAWVYATSPVQYRLGSTMLVPDARRVDQALDRETNDIEYRAIRQAAIGFDPCRHAAVLVQTQFTGAAASS